MVYAVRGISLIQGLQLFVFVVCCRVAFEFQHNVCGRSIYAQGTVDAVLFLSKKVSNYLWQHGSCYDVL
jgi:hypothetical protein